ncbi:MAG TPA: Gfo/Idh/MocA family oxidoreductase [Chloroflexota bacterium]|jgi:predicted dehydrogenase|nr:Gfo/Idh/MocA family oxidoreductase [Chloroflexota bacterium]
MGKRRALMIGAGGMAGRWARAFVPLHGERVEIVGLVDVKPEVLEATGDAIGLPLARRFTSMEEAFGQVDDADCCFVAVPPAFHEEAVVRAAEKGLAILSEKPLSDTWEACRRIYTAAGRAGVKMQVMQNYRYIATTLTLRHAVQSCDLGRINYVVARFAADYREWLAWGAEFRHKMRHALLLEGAVHHFDQLRNLAGGDPHYISGWEWNPPWSTSKGEFNNLYVLKLTNGVHASYEGSGTAGGEQNSWHEESYRVECEHGAVSLGRDKIVRVHRFRRGGGLQTEEVPLLMPLAPGHSPVKDQGHGAVIGQFLDWLDGGPTPETTLEDNIHSIAAVFAAIEASATNQTIDVAAMVAQASAPPAASAATP